MVMIDKFRKQQWAPLHIRVLDSKVTLATWTPFGAVRSSFLRLKCIYLCPISIDHGSHTIHFESDSYVAVIHADCKDIYDDDNKELSTNLYLLPVESSKQMILEPVYGIYGSYERVGLCWVYNDFAKCESANKAAAHQDNDQAFVVVDGDNEDDCQHIIELVWS